MLHIRKAKITSLMESLRIELYTALRLEQDYELLTLSHAIKVDDKKQISKSLNRLKELHLEIEIAMKALDDYQ